MEKCKKKLDTGNILRIRQRHLKIKNKLLKTLNINSNNVIEKKKINNLQMITQVLFLTGNKRIENIFHTDGS